MNSTLSTPPRSAEWLVRLCLDHVAQEQAQLDATLDYLRDVRASLLGQDHAPPRDPPRRRHRRRRLTPMSSALPMGASALTPSQRLIDLTGQNSATASTPGYHRQGADLAPISTGDGTGDGVSVIRINRQRNDLL